nr:transposase [Parafrankia sp. EUN1f]
MRTNPAAQRSPRLTEVPGGCLGLQAREESGFPPSGAGTADSAGSALRTAYPVAELSGHGKTPVSWQPCGHPFVGFVCVPFPALSGCRAGGRAGRALRVCPFCVEQVASGSRESQARFRCVACGHRGNADVNAAVNIAAGRAVTARGGVGLPVPVNREPQQREAVFV